MNPLRESLEWLREHGWTQGKSVREDGRVCALGAMRLQTTAQFNPLFSELTDEQKAHAMACGPYVGRVIKEQYPEAWHKLTEKMQEDPDGQWFYVTFMWNDWYVENQAEVEAVFEKAAVLWEEING